MRKMNIEEETPSILDQAIENNEFIETEIDLGDADVPSHNTGFDFSDSKSSSKEFNEYDQGYKFKQGCKLCALCLTDTMIHEVYRKNRIIKDVERYLEETYGDFQDIPSYEAISRHINKHFLPIEETRLAVRRNYDDAIVTNRKRVADMDRVNEVGLMKAISLYLLEELVTQQRKDIRTTIEMTKAANQTIKTYSDLMSLEIKVCGLDGTATPEEQEKKIKDALTQFVRKIKKDEPGKGEDLAKLVDQFTAPVI